MLALVSTRMPMRWPVEFCGSMMPAELRKGRMKARGEQDDGDCAEDKQKQRGW